MFDIRSRDQSLGTDLAFEFDQLGSRGDDGSTEGHNRESIEIGTGLIARWPVSIDVRSLPLSRNDRASGSCPSGLDRPVDSTFRLESSAEP